MSQTETRPATLIYDEDCGLCVASAAWLARRVRPHRLRLVALTRAKLDPVVGQIVAGRDLAETLHLVTPDARVLAGARAVLATGRLVPRWNALAALFDHRLGHIVLEPVYQQVALHRRVIGERLGLSAACPIPPPHERQR